MVFHQLHFNLIEDIIALDTPDFARTISTILWTVVSCFWSRGTQLMQGCFFDSGNNSLPQSQTQRLKPHTVFWAPLIPVIYPMVLIIGKVTALQAYTRLGVNVEDSFKLQELYICWRIHWTTANLTASYKLIIECGTEYIPVPSEKDALVQSTVVLFRFTDHQGTVFQIIIYCALPHTPVFQCVFPHFFDKISVENGEP